MKPLKFQFAHYISALIAFILATMTLNAQDTWIQKAAFPSIARMQTVQFSINGKGYIGTGTGDSGIFKDFWEYDPTNDLWTQKANFGGTERVSAVGFSIDNKGYVGTGFDLNVSFKKDFWEFDPSENKWTKKANFGGLARGGAVGFSINGKGYIGTGLNRYDHLMKDFWEYDPQTDIWTKIADFLGEARDNAVGFSIGDKGYIGTGFNGNFLSDFWEYIPASNLWRERADLSNYGGFGRLAPVGFSIKGKGYLGTGWNGNSLKDLWEYDPDANTWRQRSDFAGAPRFYACGFSINGIGYVGFGIGAIYYSDFWEYTPDSSCVPPNAMIMSLGNLDICETGFVDLKATGGDNYSYQWRLNSEILQGTTHQLYHATKPGQYEVRITDSIGCSSVSRKTTVYSSCKSSSKTEFNLSLNLFPNPNDGEFSLNLTTGNEENASAKVEVLNEFGGVIFSNNAQLVYGKLQQEVNLRNVSPGVYMVNVISSDQVYSSRIYLQK